MSKSVTPFLVTRFQTITNAKKIRHVLKREIRKLKIQNIIINGGVELQY